MATSFRPSMSLTINDRGVVFVEAARIEGLTAKGGLLISAGNGGGFRIDVDDDSLRRLRDMIDLRFMQDRSSQPSRLEQSAK